MQLTGLLYTSMIRSGAKLFDFLARLPLDLNAGQGNISIAWASKNPVQMSVFHEITHFSWGYMLLTGLCCMCVLLREDVQQYCRCAWPWTSSVKTEKVIHLKSIVHSPNYTFCCGESHLVSVVLFLLEGQSEAKYLRFLDAEKMDNFRARYRV